MIKDFLRKTDLSEDSKFASKLKIAITTCLLLFMILFSVLFVVYFYDMLIKEISAVILATFISGIIVLTAIEEEDGFILNKILTLCKYVSLKDYERNYDEMMYEAEKLENESNLLLAQAKTMKQNAINLSKFKKSIGD